MIDLSYRDIADSIRYCKNNGCIVFSKKTIINELKNQESKYNQISNLEIEQRIQKSTNKIEDSIANKLIAYGVLQKITELGEIKLTCKNEIINRLTIRDYVDSNSSWGTMKGKLYFAKECEFFFTIDSIN